MEKPSFIILSSILRCSDSFEFSAYRAWAAKRFMEAWSKDPEDISPDHLPLSAALQAIAIVTKYKMPELRKRAFYEIARRADMGQDEKKPTNNGGSLKCADLHFF